MKNNHTAENISKSNLKFSEDECQNIIEYYYENNCSYRELAEHFQTSHTTAREIILGIYGNKVQLSVFEEFKKIVSYCEELRIKYLETKDKKYWRALIQLLPESWLQTRTVTMSYENLRNMYFARKNHKLQEWHTFCDWVEKLPYFKELFLV